MDFANYQNLKKHQSKIFSGMTTRLVFNVINFKPDILIADEILANSDDSLNLNVYKVKTLNDDGTILFITERINKKLM